MKFKMVHTNFNVLDLEKSLAFYKEALGLTEERRNEAPDGSHIIVFLGDGAGEHKLELTWLRDWKEPYDLGDEEFHLCFTADDYDGAYELHKKMDCICQDKKSPRGLYFIQDPDGYWLEVVPAK